MEEPLRVTGAGRPQLTCLQRKQEEGLSLKGFNQRVTGYDSSKVTLAMGCRLSMKGPRNWRNKEEGSRDLSCMRDARRV